MNATLQSFAIGYKSAAETLKFCWSIATSPRAIKIYKAIAIASLILCCSFYWMGQQARAIVQPVIDEIVTESLQEDLPEIEQPEVLLIAPPIEPEPTPEQPKVLIDPADVDRVLTATLTRNEARSLCQKYGIRYREGSGKKRRDLKAEELQDRLTAYFASVL